MHGGKLKNYFQQFLKFSTKSSRSTSYFGAVQVVWKVVVQVVWRKDSSVLEFKTVKMKIKYKIIFK